MSIIAIIGLIASLVFKEKSQKKVLGITSLCNLIVSFLPSKFIVIKLICGVISIIAFIDFIKKTYKEKIN